MLLPSKFPVDLDIPSHSHLTKAITRSSIYLTEPATRKPFSLDCCPLQLAPEPFLQAASTTHHGLLFTGKRSATGSVGCGLTRSTYPRCLLSAVRDGFVLPAAQKVLSFALPLINLATASFCDFLGTRYCFSHNL